VGGCDYIDKLAGATPALVLAAMQFLHRAKVLERANLPLVEMVTSPALLLCEQPRPQRFVARP
jgi:hypothetical protein